MSSHLKYLSCFFFPVCVAWFLYTGPHHALAALAWTTPLWLLIIADWYSPKINPNNQKRLVSIGYYNTILYVLSFLQFLNIALLLIYASLLQWNSGDDIFTSLINLVAMRILVGTSSGSSAIIVAHELIHRRKNYQRMLGRCLLYTVCYDHFVLAHMRGHHQNVATPEDMTTARLGESFQHYWERVAIGHLKYAWHSEIKRIGLKPPYSCTLKMLTNKVLQGIIIEFLLVVLIIVLFGWVAALIFLYQALSAVRLLETINYYQHWGLEKGKSQNTLAWVNQSSVTEYALIGLSNHIGHHRNASIPYQAIGNLQTGPIMPYGYFVSNLWVKLGNDSFMRTSMEILKKL